MAAHGSAAPRCAARSLRDCLRTMKRTLSTMKRTTRIVLAAGTAWAVLASPALAAASGEAKPRAADKTDARFDELDRNHDGYLTRDEAADAAELDTRFSELDVNNDGKLSRDEYRVVAQGAAATLPGAQTAGSGATHP